MKFSDIFKRKKSDTLLVESTRANQPRLELPPVPEGKVRVHNLILLDESGSMGYIYDAVLTGVNETLQTIRRALTDHPDQEHRVTLVTFDSYNYKRIYNSTLADQVADIDRSQYRPNARTPLYDAMGQSINELRPCVGKNDVVLVTVITDGYENASKEYTGVSIKHLVELLTEQGWVFTYIGANQDVDAVGDSLSIDNLLAFEATLLGASEMFSKDNECRGAFFDKISDSFPAGSDIDLSNLGKGYFESDK